MEMEHGSYDSESGDYEDQTKLTKHEDWKYQLQKK